MKNLPLSFDTEKDCIKTEKTVEVGHSTYYIDKMKSGGYALSKDEHPLYEFETVFDALTWLESIFFRGAKVQTNEYKVNVLVETTNSSNQHYSSLDKTVDIVEVLTDHQILQVWLNRDTKDELALAKDWIKRQEGYAISDCSDDTINLSGNGIVKYKNHE